ncbi:MAG: hypothetical protein Q9227_007411 [Pyrenula ochraceoflavens]
MPTSPSHGHSHSGSENMSVGSGPDPTTGPIRHPRPLTAAELHAELEKEQEAVVNRLTRELSALRQQTASVASTTSSASTNDYSGGTTTTSASIVPTEARRHRSSSSLSTRSITANTGNMSVSGVAAPREASVPSSRPSMDLTSRPSLSRENSAARRGHSPALQSSQFGGGSSTATTAAAPYPGPGGGYSILGERTPSQTSRQASSAADYAMHQRSPSFSSAIAAARYEEAAFHRAELENVKKENDLLKQRIRELERSLSQQGERG